MSTDAKGEGFSHDGGFNHLLHSVQTATVPGCTTPEAIGVAAENLSAAGAFDTLPLRNPEYDGPAGIFTDYEGCDSGIDTKPAKPAKTFIPFGI